MEYKLVNYKNKTYYLWYMDMGPTSRIILSENLNDVGIKGLRPTREEREEIVYIGEIRDKKLKDLGI